MVVLYPNKQLRVRQRAHPFARDAHGQPIATVTPDWGEAHPGSVLENSGTDADVGVTFSCRLDAKQWPLEEDDQIQDQDGVVYVITTASIHVIAGRPNSRVNHVKATAVRLLPKVP